MDTSILQKIQSDLKCPKSQYNSFGKYNYRNAEDIQEALKPILAKYGHSLTISDEIVQVGERIYIRALVQLLDAALEPIASTTAYAREPESRKGMDEAQVTGATSSYARKYALGGMFLLDDTKDADSMESPKPDEKTKKPPQKNETKKEFTFIEKVEYLKNAINDDAMFTDCLRDNNVSDYTKVTDINAQNKLVDALKFLNESLKKKA